MKMLTGKPLLFFCYIFMYLTNFVIKAQHPYPFYVGHYDPTYTPNSTYRGNLDAALTTLPNTDTGYGYFNASAGQGTDTANAVCLCRGDVELNMCQRCLREAIFQLRVTCPNQREAVIYYEFCLLKYSNAVILGNNVINTRDVYYLNSINSFPDKQQFYDLLGPFMNKLRSETASGSSLLKFAMENTTGPGTMTLYGLTQCIPSLSETQCNECLEYAINQFPVCCDGRVGAVVLMVSCNVRYEIYEYNINPAVLPPPSRPSTNSQPSPPGEKSSKTRIIILVIIPTVIAIVIASICIFIVLRRKKTKVNKDPNPPSPSLLFSEKSLVAAFMTPKSNWSDSMVLMSIVLGSSPRRETINIGMNIYALFFPLSIEDKFINNL